MNHLCGAANTIFPLDSTESASFRARKSCPNENKEKCTFLAEKGHKKTVWREKNRKANNKNLLIESRKHAREVVGPLENEGIKGKLIEDRNIAEKLNEFFASILVCVLRVIDLCEFKYMCSAPLQNKTEKNCLIMQETSPATPFTLFMLWSKPGIEE